MVDIMVPLADSAGRQLGRTAGDFVANQGPILSETAFSAVSGGISGGQSQGSSGILPGILSGIGGVAGGILGAEGGPAGVAFGSMVGSELGRLGGQGLQSLVAGEESSNPIQGPSRHIIVPPPRQRQDQFAMRTQQGRGQPTQGQQTQVIQREILILRNLRIREDELIRESTGTPAEARELEAIQRLITESEDFLRSHGVDVNSPDISPSSGAGQEFESGSSDIGLLELREATDNMRQAREHLRVLETDRRRTTDPDTLANLDLQINDLQQVIIQLEDEVNRTRDIWIRESQGGSDASSDFRSAYSVGDRTLDQSVDLRSRISGGVIFDRRSDMEGGGGGGGGGGGININMRPLTGQNGMGQQHGLNKQSRLANLTNAMKARHPNSVVVDQTDIGVIPEKTLKPFIRRPSNHNPSNPLGINIPVRILNLPNVASFTAGAFSSDADVGTSVPHAFAIPPKGGTTLLTTKTKVQPLQAPRKPRKSKAKTTPLQAKRKSRFS